MNWKFLTAIPVLLFAQYAAQRPQDKWSVFNVMDIAFLQWTQPVTQLTGGGIENIPRKCSPTLTIRAIRSHLIKWRIQTVNIVTERKLSLIAYQWVDALKEHYDVHPLKILDSASSRKPLRNLDSMLEDDQSLNFNPGYVATIFVLDAAVISTRVIHDAEINAIRNKYRYCKVIIVGRCIPKAMKRFSSDVHINTVLVTSSIKDWLKGNVPANSISFYSLQAKSKTRFSATPFRRVNSDGSISYEVEPHRYYGYIEEKHIFVGFSKLQRSVASCKNNLPSGFGGDYIKSLQSYLKFRIHCQCISEGTTLSEWMRNDTVRKDLADKNCSLWPDIHLVASAPFLIGFAFRLLPQFFQDKIAFFVLKEDEKISLIDLITLIEWSIWIFLFLCIIFINICFLAIYYQNPVLQRSIKVRNKVMSKMANCFSLHGLSFFQSEWQQGPTASSKWILFTYNILLLIFSCMYITLYTDKIFSLKKLTHLTAQDMLNSSFVFAGSMDFYGWLVLRYCFHKNHNSVLCSGQAMSSVLADDINNVFGNLTNGKWAVVGEVYAVAFKPMKKFPEIGVVKDLGLQYSFAFKCEMFFDFMEIFHSVTLKMKETGVQNKLITTHFDFKVVPKSVLNPVAFELIWYLPVILGSGAVIALIACLIEKFTFVQSI